MSRKMAAAGNVILIGFMGSGKSAVGRLLARRLGRCFVETDDLIVAQEGRSIPEIFRGCGEARFRELEAGLLDLLRLKQGDVIATGGGFPCREGRMEALKALGTVIWLAGDFDLLYARALRSGARPMLEGKSREEVAALYRSREPYYRQAHLTVETAGKGVDQVVRRIQALLPEAEGRRPAGEGVG
jgi:shikimate kinase